MLQNKTETVSTNQVQLQFYKPEHDKALSLFYLPEEQLQFTGMPNEVLIVAKEDAHRIPIVIVNEDNPVGFFVLYDGEEKVNLTSNPNAFTLRAFSINHAEQGKGYAKQGLLQLKDFVQEHFPHVDEVVLAVNMRNIAAKHLYLKCGFEDRGETRMGPKGPQHILFLNMKSL